MRKIIAVLMFVLLGIIRAQSPDPAQFKPEKPVLGEKVTITYNPHAKDALLQEVDGITLEVLYVIENIPVAYMITAYDPVYPVYKEYKMKKVNKAWEAEFTLDVPNSKILLYRFSSGNLLDENNGRSWFTVIYEKDGLPSENACYMLSEMYINGYERGNYDFRFERDMKKYEEVYKNEMKYRPMSLHGATSRWSDMKNQKDTYEQNKPQILKEMDELYARYKDNEKGLIPIIWWYKRIGDTLKFKQIESNLKSISPAGDYMVNGFLGDFRLDGDAEKQQEVLKKVYSIPNLPVKVNKIFTLLRLAAYQIKNNADSAFVYLKNSGWTHPVFYNRILKFLLNMDYKTGDVLSMAKKNMERAGTDSAMVSIAYISRRGNEKLFKEYMSMIISTYALACDKNGHTEEAYRYYSEAYKMKNDDLELTEEFGAFLNRTKRYDEAITLIKKAVEINCYNSKILDTYKSAYVSLNGSDKGYGEISDKIRENTYKNLTKDLVNKPAPDFELKKIEGGTVKLGDLKGKIIILDFWATWCGPCKESFPTFQKLYNKFKSNPDIVFLAVNCSESWRGEERIKNVSKFITEKNYTFPVVIDEVNNANKKYNVEGIPTKFIIDKEGMIQFKDVGFSDDSAMMDDVSNKIELLLSGFHKKNFK